MAGLLDVFGAFKAGKEIANPALWKNVGQLTKSVGILASTLITFYRLFVGELPITDEQVIVLSGCIATALLTFSNIIAVVTTKKNVSLTGVVLNPTVPDDTK